eukprot:3366854-Amphidinium_carterae.1
MSVENSGNPAIRIESCGNPAMYMTWADEGFHWQVRTIAQTLHSHTFEARLLHQVNIMACKMW